MNSHKAIRLILLTSLLPLLFALFLGVYFWLDLAQLTSYAIPFARLNAYIYAHAYGAILLSAFCGMNIGQSLNHSHAGGFILLNTALILLSWLSYQSFGDFQGMIFLIFCWVCLMAIIYFTDPIQSSKQLKSYILKIQFTIIIILGLITAING